MNRAQRRAEQFGPIYKYRGFKNLAIEQPFVGDHFNAKAA